ncbi:MAG: hypothetical protein ACRED0_02225 [Gammaproteobacteria bacterium]
MVLEPRVDPQAMMPKTMMAKSVMFESVVAKTVMAESVVAKTVMAGSKAPMKTAHLDETRWATRIAFLVTKLISIGRGCGKRQRHPCRSYQMHSHHYAPSMLVQSEARPKRRRGFIFL